MKKFFQFLLFIFIVSCASFNTGFNNNELNHCPIDIDKNLTLTLMLASIQTYNSFDNIPLTPLNGYNTPIVFSGMVNLRNEKLGLIYKSNQNPLKIIVAFRGSKTAQDWLNDFKYISTSDYRTNYVDVPGILVEQGFFLTYNAVRNKVMDLLKNIIGNNTDVTIYVTGHSLGGASATLFVLDLNYNTSNNINVNKNNVYITTFAAPRVGNDKFVEVYSQYVMNSIRIINQTDTVPELPLEDTFGHYYKHVDSQFSIFFYPKKYSMGLTLPAHQKYIIFLFKTFNFKECRFSCHNEKNYFYALEKIFNINTGLDDDLQHDDLIIINPFIKLY